MTLKPTRESGRDLGLVEDEIKDTVHYLRKLKVHKHDTWVQDHINNNNTSLPPNNMYPKYNKSLNYYHEFWRTYLLNEMLINKIKENASENKVLGSKICELDNLHKEYNKLV